MIEDRDVASLLQLSPDGSARRSTGTVRCIRSSRVSMVAEVETAGRRATSRKTKKIKLRENPARDQRLMGPCQCCRPSKGLVRSCRERMTIRLTCTALAAFAAEHAVPYRSLIHGRIGANGFASLKTEILSRARGATLRARLEPVPDFRDHATRVAAPSLPCTYRAYQANLPQPSAAGRVPRHGATKPSRHFLDSTGSQRYLP